MFTLDQLEALCAIGRYQTMTSAAAALHISQPSLSRSMQALERELGVSLFERTKNRAVLNENGQKALGMAEEILKRCRQMQDQLQEFDRKNRAVTIYSCAPRPLELLIGELGRKDPFLQVTGSVKAESGLPDLLRSGQADAIIVSSDDAKELKSAGIFCRPLMQEKLAVVLPKDDPLAGNDKIRLQDLDGRTMLLLENIGIWRPLVEKAMPNTRFVVQRDLSAMEVLSRESSLPFFVTNAFNAFQADDRIRIPVIDPEASRMFYLCAPDPEKCRLEAFFEDRQPLFQFPDFPEKNGN